jgi:hypothetical protein
MALRASTIGEPQAVRLDAFQFAERRSISGRVETAQ